MIERQVMRSVAPTAVVRTAIEEEVMARYLIQEWWGRVCLHLVAALRAGHWRWHLAGIGREFECLRLQPSWAAATAKG